MKKYLISLVLICLLALLPNNAYALARIDENGKTIVGETQDGEYTILAEPNIGESDGNSSSTDSITPEDKAVSSNDNISTTDGIGSDDIYTTTAQEDAELLANNEEKKDNDILLIVISSIIGLLIGSVGTYLFILKRR